MYNVRNAQESDFNFIISSLKSAELHKIDRDLLFRILYQACDMYVLTPQDDTDLIVCVCITCDDNLVWVYVKEIYRRIGIANYMLNMCNVSKQFMFKGTGEAWKHLTKKRQLKWNPYLILSTLSFINQ